MPKNKRGLGGDRREVSVPQYGGQQVRTYTRFQLAGSDPAAGGGDQVVYAPEYDNQPVRAVTRIVFNDHHRRHRVADRVQRPRTGRAPRGACNARTRGSRRVTRAGPSCSDDPEPPGERHLAPRPTTGVAL